MSDLREGLAKTLLDGQIVFTHERAAINLIDELVKVIRQHDGHAEFVRAVLTEASRDVGPNDRDYRLDNIVGMCADELAKEKSNG